MFDRYFPVTLLLLAVAVPLAVSIHMNQGHFLYTLDDPYIHMALARGISSGHYGINDAENTAPSSSILWPLILVPFSRVPFFEVAPLVLNLVFASFTSFLLYRFFRRRNAFFFAVSVFAFNLPGLVLTGMEHSLQLLLTVVIAVGACRFAEEGKISGTLTAALVLAPLVRYECLAVSLPVIAWLFLAGERKKSLCVLAAVVACIAAFSVFLLSLGLDPLPASVFAKSSVVAEGTVLSNLAASLKSFRGAVQALLLIPLGFFIFKGRGEGRERLLAAACAAGVLMHLAAGRFGWFHRYGAYMWAFSVVICFHIFRPFFEKHRVFSTLLLLAASANYMTGYARIPGASSNIYRQQYQMARFSACWLTEPVAVNDLGLVALYSEHYVLDLWGLATPEALDGASDPVWVDSAASARGVGLAIVYSDELPGIRHWSKIARMELHPPLVVCPQGGVDFMAAPWADIDHYSELVDDFAETLPNGIDLIRYR